MAYEPRMSKAARKRLAAYRKETLSAADRVYGDLARVADVSYSMADKWMNARRTSKDCERAFVALTGKPALPAEMVAA
jgi:hypothetical protein